MDKPRPVFVLHLEGLPDRVPVDVRLRRALKLLGRAFGLRCRLVRDATEEEKKKSA